MKKRHINIPIFITHMGCPNMCVFCNQRTISGHASFDPDELDSEIERVLSTAGADSEREIAFFGGSFTGIDRSLMVELLTRAQGYIDRGAAGSIRLSTRPDYINAEILEILGRYSVKTVELGLQSLDDRVLEATKRGHDRECALRACRDVVSAGFDLVGQMMIGLPLSNSENERETARLICEVGAVGARVYPTVVFRGTELSEMTANGIYTPISNEEAVVRTKDVLDIFDRAGVQCIRVGLCASENLSDESEVVGGANHSAIGEMAMGELYFDRICSEIERLGYRGGELKIYVSRGSVSKASGQNRRNKTRFCEKYGFKSVKVLEKNEIIGYNIILEHYLR